MLSDYGAMLTSVELGRGDGKDLFFMQFEYAHKLVVSGIGQPANSAESFSRHLANHHREILAGRRVPGEPNPPTGRVHDGEASKFERHGDFLGLGGD